MTAADDEANRRHLAALIGSRDTRWQEHIEQGLKVLDTQWDKLPRSFIRRWWKATDYGQRPPSLGSAAQLPELLTAAQAKLEHTKREIAADTAHARGFLSKARRSPCEECLRPASPCQARCLRSMLHESDPRRAPGAPVSSPKEV